MRINEGKIEQAVLIGKINTELAGKNAKALIGDINGDGRMELVMVQVSNVIDNIYESYQIQCITTFNLDGKLLWQVGKPNNNPGNIKDDFPAQIVDIDGDGNNEVICVIDKKFNILNGKTGQVKRSFDLPDNEAHDCIIVANLTGNEFPQDIILKNKHKKMWAMDKDFNLLWVYEGNLGNYPWIYDINGDGKDEIMAGYDMLDCQGNKMWSCNCLVNYAECIGIGDVTYNPASGVEIVIGGSENPTVMYNWNGEELWRCTNSLEATHIALGKFRDDMLGVQIVGIDSSKSRDLKGEMNDSRDTETIFLLDNTGNEVIKKVEKTNGCLTIIETLHNWAGLKRDHILAYSIDGSILPRLYNGYLKTVVTFPSEGYVVHGDLLNNGTECVIIYSDGIANIFSHKDMDINNYQKGITIKQSKRLSHSTLYKGGDLDNIAHIRPKSELKSDFKNLIYKFPLDNGIYDITMMFGSENDESNIDKVLVGDRRLMIDGINTSIGTLDKRKFSINILDKELNIVVTGENPVVNSINIEKSEAKTIFLAGDSTVCDQYEEPYMGWGQFLPCLFKEGVAISNHAFSGRSTVSFIKEKRLQNILEVIKPGDYLFIQFGHNDQKIGAFYAGVGEKYNETLKLYVDAARKKGAEPVLITPMHRRSFYESNKIINTLEDYPKAMKSVAKEMNVPLIDLNEGSEVLFNKLGPEKCKKLFLHFKPGELEKYPNGIIDDTHFSELGARCLAEIVVDGVEKNNLSISKFLR